MARFDKTFRIFVSSTFSDMKKERNALQEEVFPRLRRLCLDRSTRFQAIDLRWGVSEEAGLDQRTMRICISELERCRDLSPRPNFIVLLGDRYGWVPLPEVVPADEFERVTACVEDGNDRKLIDEWYKRDDNAVPAEYLLQPRHNTGCEDWDKWSEVEGQLRRALATAAQKAAQDGAIPADALGKYLDSATHQEIIHGALKAEDAPDHVFCFFREIENRDDLVNDIENSEDPENEPAAEFIDNQGPVFDEDAHKQLQGVKSDLENMLPDEHVFRYNSRWENRDITEDHLKQLCDDVYKSLAGIIEAELDKVTGVDALEKEMNEQEDFREDRCRFFAGREDSLAAIAKYIERGHEKPLVVHGPGGSGKSALVGKAVEQAKAAHPKAKVAFRFIGATPSSSDGRALLEGINREIVRAYGEDESTVTSTWADVTQEFEERLALGTAEKPLVIFIDSLDQVSALYNADELYWVPRKVPEHARVIVTLRDGKQKDFLARMLDDENFVALPPMGEETGNTLLDAWLKNVGRWVQEFQRQTIMENFNREGLPLYLKLAFEEAVRWHSYTENIELKPDVKGIIQGLYERLSLKENHGEVLVGRTLAYIAASRYGLSEDELVDVLSRDREVYKWFILKAHHFPSDLVKIAAAKIEGIEQTSLKGLDKEDQEKTQEWLSGLLKQSQGRLDEFLDYAFSQEQTPRLPIILWARLYSDLEPYLGAKSAEGAVLLDFYHRELEEVAKANYLKEKSGDYYARNKHLADYFYKTADPSGELKWNGPTRGLAELPYHQAMAAMWDDLFNTMTNFPFLEQKAARVGLAELRDAKGNVKTVYGGVDSLHTDYEITTDHFPEE